MNACDAVQELLAAHLLEALEDSEQTLVREHLAFCERCQAAREDTAAALSFVAAPPVAPPEELWRKLRARIEREATADPVRHAEPSPIVSLSCSYCRGGMTRRAAVYCASCLAPHHPECFAEYGRCSVMGCSETRIVRPADLPPLRLRTGARRRPRPRARPRPRRRRRWLTGGLSALLLTGTGVAAFHALDEREGLVVERPHWEVRPTSLAYRLEVREATLGEVVEAVRALPEAPRVELPTELRSLLVRRADFDGVHWTTALSRVAEGLGLELVRAPQGGGWALRAPRGYDPEDWPRAFGDELEVDRCLEAPLVDAGEPHPLHTGWELRLVAPPRPGPAFAVLGERRLLLFRDGEPLGARTVEFPIRAAAWSVDGRRLAYVAGGDGEGELGLFTLHGTALDHRVVRSFSGVGASSQLAWCGPNTLLLRGEDTLRAVSTVLGGPAITLSRPSPKGFRRFDVLGVGEGAFLVLYPDGAQAWDLESASPLYERVPLPVGYRVSPPVHDGRRWVSLVTTEAAAALFDPLRGVLGREPLQERSSERGAWRADLSPDGRVLACLEDGELFLRCLDAEGAAEGVEVAGPVGARVRGFRWGPAGALLCWTEGAVYLDGWGRAPELVFECEGSLRDVRWTARPLLGAEDPFASPEAFGLVVTARVLDQRLGRVRLVAKD